MRRLFLCYIEVCKKGKKKEYQRCRYERMPRRRCQDLLATAVAMPLLSNLPMSLHDSRPSRRACGHNATFACRFSPHPRGSYPEGAFPCVCARLEEFRGLVQSGHEQGLDFFRAHTLAYIIRTHAVGICAATVATKTLAAELRIGTCGHGNGSAEGSRARRGFEHKKGTSRCRRWWPR